MTHLPRILVAALAATLITAGTAHAAIAPTLSSPSNGKSVKKGGKLTFKAKLDSASEASGVFVLVSKSKKTNAEGLISDKMYMRTMKLSGGSYTNTVEKYPALTSWFLNRPGKYYWQAYAIDCSDGTDDCSIESSIRSFRIK